MRGIALLTVLATSLSVGLAEQSLSRAQLGLGISDLKANITSLGSFTNATRQASDWVNAQFAQIQETFDDFTGVLQENITALQDDLVDLRDETDENIVIIQQNVTSVNDTLNTLIGGATWIASKLENVQGQIDAMNEKITELNSTIESANIEILDTIFDYETRLNSSIADTNNEVDALDERFDMLEEALDDNVRNQTETLKEIKTEFGRYEGYQSEVESVLAGNFSELRATYDDLTADAQRVHDLLDANTTRLEYAIVDYNRQFNDSRNSIAAVNGSVSATSGRLVKLNADYVNSIRQLNVTLTKLGGTITPEMIVDLQKQIDAINDILNGNVTNLISTISGKFNITSRLAALSNDLAQAAPELENLKQSLAKQSNDLKSWINGNTTDLQNDFTALRNNVSYYYTSLSSTITNLTDSLNSTYLAWFQRLNSNFTNVQSLDTQVQSIDDGISTLSDRLDTESAALNSNIQTTFDTLDETMDILSGRVDELRLETAQQVANASEAVYSMVLDDIDGLNGTLNVAAEMVEIVRTDLTNLQALRETFEETARELVSMNTSVNALYGDLADLDNRVVDQQTTLDQYQQQLTNLETVLDAKTSDIVDYTNTLASDRADLEAQISGVQAGFDTYRTSIDSDIANFDGQVDGISSTIEQLKTNASTLTGRVETLENRVKEYLDNSIPVTATFGVSPGPAIKNPTEPLVEIQLEVKTSRTLYMFTGGVVYPSTTVAYQEYCAAAITVKGEYTNTPSEANPPAVPFVRGGSFTPMTISRARSVTPGNYTIELWVWAGGAVLNTASGYGCKASGFLGMILF